MESIEEINNLKTLRDRFHEVTQKGYLPNILDEIIKQSKVEFNFEDEE
jgi:hypothetical protein